MAQRTSHRWLVFLTFALLASLSVTRVKADPLYTVTNLGSPAGVTLTTASGGTIAAYPNGYESATSQLVSVSNGEVSYSFATTPDTALIQGQGALSSVPASLNIAPNVYSSPEVSGFVNANGFAALVTALPVTDFPIDAYVTAAAYPIGPNGQVEWSQGATIASSPNNGATAGNIGIAGINTANQALVGTGFAGLEYNSLVYNLSTHSLTNLDSLPAIASGDYNNLQPIAIDDQGQILVEATPGSSNSSVTLLLTPGGAPPEPFATPEPSTWLIWMLTAGTALRLVKRWTGARPRHCEAAAST